MNDEYTLDLNVFDNIPPWESGNPDSETFPSDQVFENQQNNNGLKYSASDDSLIDEVDGEPEELEIYKKARNFQALKLKAGSLLGCPVKKYVADNYGVEGLQRYSIAEYLLRSLNFIASPDVLLMLSCPKRARVIIATAGAGKTTGLQLDLLISNALDRATGIYGIEPEKIEGTSICLPRILYLNYNKHNVEPIRNRYQYLCSRVNKVIEEEISDSIDSSTVHAFCHRWLTAFADEINLPAIKIIDDNKKKELWLAVALPRWKKFYNEEELGVDWQVLDSLYQYKTESMLDWDEFFLTAKFVDSDLKPEFVKPTLKKYESMKSSMGLMDFTDYLVLMIKVLKEHPELKNQIVERYGIIVADENQDFTRLMNELLLQIYDANKNRIIVVGDPDQTIYAFKGVSPDNVVTLYQELEDVELLGLGTNYRCPDKIVDAAKKILDMNVLRFDKPIATVKTGGAIIEHPLSSTTEQVSAVLGLVNKLGEESWGKTVITYRNNKSSIIVGEELYYAGIPFNIIDDKRPFNNMVFNHIRTAILALQEKDNKDLNYNLFRFMPVTKELWAKVIDANSKHHRHYLPDLIIPKDMPRGTDKAFGILVHISSRIDTSPCSDYVGVLFELYRTYFYNFLMKNPNPALGDEDMYSLWLERSEKFWTRPYTFDYLCRELRERNVDREDAITLSTFHGLKGLEFDYVITLDFNDNIFPNFQGIEQRYPPNTAKEEQESENRLCYVLITRAIKELHLFYLKLNPSYYVSKICESNNAGDDDIHNLSLGVATIPDNTVDAKLKFIQRLTSYRGG